MNNLEHQNQEKRIAYMDQLLFDLKAHLQAIAQFQNNIKDALEKSKTLSNYMESELWLQDNESDKGKGQYHVLGEDELYNTLMEFESMKKDILKQIINDL
ncbi:MAG TPA: DUF4298 domain-containing protein [Edaphocola sp.]|nr:DUF4298 domain-containing protein [Edaphocola sp.]